MTDIEKLALMQALYLEIGYEVKTGDPDNLRGHVNAHYLDLYDQTGATGFEVRIGGQKVGTYGFNKTRAQPARTETSIVVGDVDALRADDSDEFNEWISSWIAAHIEELAVQYAEETGDLLDGMAVVTREVPATPAGIRPNGTLRVDGAKVAEALGANLGAAVAGLLGGGE